jgi:hypothetical protein
MAYFNLRVDKVNRIHVHCSLFSCSFETEGSTPAMNGRLVFTHQEYVLFKKRLRAGTKAGEPKTHMGGHSQINDKSQDGILKEYIDKGGDWHGID